MGELLSRMVLKLRQFRSVGAEPEVFIVGRGAVMTLDQEVDAMGLVLVQDTRGRRHRELLGTPVILSRTARPEGVELIVRRETGPVSVQIIQ